MCRLSVRKGSAGSWPEGEKEKVHLQSPLLGKEEVSLVLGEMTERTEKEMRKRPRKEKRAVN